MSLLSLFFTYNILLWALVEAKIEPTSSNGLMSFITVGLRLLALSGSTFLLTTILAT
jgi:hypothetical protein